MAGQLRCNGCMACESGEAANLKRLSLWNTAITDQGLAFLSKLPQLSVLDLEETHVTIDGIAQLAKLQKLKQIHLYGTAVTDEEFMALKKRVPGATMISVHFHLPRDPACPWL
jgi:hypothetical protein